jgi:hypothetical protein
MDIKKVLERLDQLVSRGVGLLPIKIGEHFLPRGILSTHDMAEAEREKAALFVRWKVNSLTFLKTFANRYDYYNEFMENCKRDTDGEILKGLEVLKGLKEDIEGGYLTKIETLVSGEVFSDFLDMAEHLLDNGYKDPAASLIGAVLEDSLRRMCINNTLPVKSGDNISTLNQRLASKKGVYNRLQQGKIGVWNNVRDSADHGRFGEYKEDDVKDMLEAVRKFLDDYLK